MIVILDHDEKLSTVEQEADTVYRVSITGCCLEKVKGRKITETRLYLPPYLYSFVRGLLREGQYEMPES